MKRARRRIFFILPFVLFTTALATGCATGGAHYASSVVDYLYPHTKDPVVTPSVPVLSPPIRVGIAFVPSKYAGTFSTGMFRGNSDLILTEEQKTELMQQVADHFEKYPFVKSIEIIPSAYLTPGGSFTNLDQIRTMYGVDVIALLSYDQMQFTDEGALSLTYWTIVGAYIVPGEKNDTSTMLDAVVYDIPSRKMLFRAPGTSQIKGHATPVNLSEQRRKDSKEGFKDAATHMIANLDQQLALFKDKVKAHPVEYRVVPQAGYTGGGSTDIIMLVLSVTLAGVFLWTRRG